MKKLLLIILVISNITNISMAYTDLPQSHWAYKYIEDLTQKKLVSGYLNSEFRPENILTKAEFTAMLINTLGFGVDSSSDYWADGFIKKALENGIIENDIEGDLPITRYEMFKMIVRSFENTKQAYELENNYNSPFVDYELKNHEIGNIVGILYKTKIVKGYPDNTVKLSGNTTRAEAVTVISKLIENKAMLENFTGDIHYYKGSKYVPKQDLPEVLDRLENEDNDTAPVTTIINSVEIFPFAEGRNGKYKEVFDEIALGDELYYRYKQGKGEGQYIMAVNFTTKNNLEGHDTLAGHSMLDMDFIDEPEIFVQDGFDLDEMEYQRNGLPYIGINLLYGQSHTTTAFYIINKEPKGKIEFIRCITTMRDVISQKHIAMISFHSLTVGLDSTNNDLGNGEKRGNMEE